MDMTENRFHRPVIWARSKRCSAFQERFPESRNVQALKEADGRRFFQGKQEGATTGCEKHAGWLRHKKIADQEFNS